MSKSLSQDIMSRLPTDGAAAEPRVEPERGVRLIDGKLLYSDMWLDDEQLDDEQLDAADRAEE